MQFNLHSGFFLFQKIQFRVWALPDDDLAGDLGGGVVARDRRGLGVGARLRREGAALAVEEVRQEAAVALAVGAGDLGIRDDRAVVVQNGLRR